MYQILDLPNIGGQYYLTGFDDLPAYGRTGSEVYSAILSLEGNPKPQLNWRQILESFPNGLLEM